MQYKLRNNKATKLKVLPVLWNLSKLRFSGNRGPTLQENSGGEE